MQQYFTLPRKTFTVVACSLSTTFILPSCWTWTVFCPDYAPLHSQTCSSKCVTCICYMLDITLRFLFLPWENSIPLNTKTCNSLSPMFQWKRWPEQCIHGIFNELNLELNEKYIFTLVSKSLYKMYSGGYLPLAPHEDMAGPMPFQFILSLHSCSHFTNQCSRHSFKKIPIPDCIKNS